MGFFIHDRTADEQELICEFCIKFLEEPERIKQDPDRLAVRVHDGRVLVDVFGIVRFGGDYVRCRWKRRAVDIARALRRWGPQVRVPVPTGPDQVYFEVPNSALWEWDELVGWGIDVDQLIDRYEALDEKKGGT